MKHLADHDRSPSGARMKNFVQIARDRSESLWRAVWQKPRAEADSNRRVLEYARIERGRRV